MDGREAVHNAERRFAGQKGRARRIDTAEAAGEDADMKKFARFLFDTWYGAAVAFAVSLAGVVAGMLFCFLVAGQIAAKLFGALLLLSGLVLAAAFVRSLWKRAWGRAAAQLLLGLAGAAGFVPAWVAAGFCSIGVAHKMGWHAPWVEVAGKNGVVPFEVEYRPATTFTAEHDRRVAFASGKRVGIAMNTGGHAALAVYALEDGTHALADGAGFWFRVDAAAETVEEESAGRWFRLPDGTEKGVGRSTGGVPVGTSLDGRRLVGKFVPLGRFVAEAENLPAPEP
jgi:hypothetical protein